MARSITGGCDGAGDAEPSLRLEPRWDIAYLRPGLAAPDTVGALFDAVFAVFVVSMALIAALAVRWGLRRDRAERRRRLEGRAPGGAGSPGTTAP